MLIEQRKENSDHLLKTTDTQGEGIQTTYKSTSPALDSEMALSTMETCWNSNPLPSDTELLHKHTKMFHEWCHFDS
jgi:hypothetical protein